MPSMNARKNSSVKVCGSVNMARIAAGKLNQPNRAAPNMTTVQIIA